ncbi:MULTISPECIES: hypothetical protein [unclassified Microcoleus]|uniref:hypothetical protein n=1 Tax=unclassified Microcoleus TaxID=2642155 RepID=UPI002FD2FC63
MRSPAKPNLELKPDALTKSIFRWEDMNGRLLHSISQELSTISININASKHLSLLVGINRSYSHIYLAKS